MSENTQRKSGRTFLGNKDVEVVFEIDRGEVMAWTAVEVHGETRTIRAYPKEFKPKACTHIADLENAHPRKVRLKIFLDEAKDYVYAHAFLFDRRTILPEEDINIERFEEFEEELYFRREDRRFVARSMRTNRPIVMDRKVRLQRGARRLLVTVREPKYDIMLPGRLPALLAFPKRVSVDVTILRPICPKPGIADPKGIEDFVTQSVTMSAYSLLSDRHEGGVVLTPQSTPEEIEKQATTIHDRAAAKAKTEQSLLVKLFMEAIADAMIRAAELLLGNEEPTPEEIEKYGVKPEHFVSVADVTGEYTEDDDVVVNDEISEADEPVAQTEPEAKPFVIDPDIEAFAKAKMAANKKDWTPELLMKAFLAAQSKDEGLTVKSFLSMAQHKLDIAVHMAKRAS